MGLILLIFLLLAVAGVAVYHKGDPIKTLVTLLFGIPTLAILAVAVAVGGVIGGGTTLLFSAVTGSVFPASLIGAALAGVSFYVLAELLFRKLMKARMPARKDYISAPLAYVIGTLVGTNGAFYLVADPTLAGAAAVMASGALPLLLLSLFFRLGVLKLPVVKKDG